MASDNRQTIRRLYDAYARGDSEAVLQSLSDDFEWHSRGAAPFSGYRDGRDAGRHFETRWARLHPTQQRITHGMPYTDTHAVASAFGESTRERQVLTGSLGVTHPAFSGRGNPESLPRGSSREAANPQFPTPYSIIRGWLNRK